MELGLGEVNGQFGIALLWVCGGILFVVMGLFVSRLIRPHRPNPEKLSSYECGEEPIGNARIQLNNRFYVAALIFLLFDVEIVFLFPWATVFADAGLIASVPSWGILALVEMFVFIAVLLLGLAYVWAKGDLDWVRSEPITEKSPANIPDEAYKSFNSSQSNVTLSGKQTSRYSS